MPPHPPELGASAGAEGAPNARRLSALIAENSALLAKLVGGAEEGATAGGGRERATHARAAGEPTAERRTGQRRTPTHAPTPTTASAAAHAPTRTVSTADPDLLDAYREKCSRLEAALDANAKLKARLQSRNSTLTSLEPLKQRYDEVHASRVEAEKRAVRMERRVDALVSERDRLAARVEGATRDEEIVALRRPRTPTRPTGRASPSGR